MSIFGRSFLSPKKGMRRWTDAALRRASALARDGEARSIRVAGSPIERSPNNGVWVGCAGIIHHLDDETLSIAVPAR